MVEITLAPVLRQTNDLRQGVHHDRNNGQGQEAKADPVPVVGVVEVHAHTAQHSESGESVGLPAEIVQFESAIDQGEHESEYRPHGCEPRARSFEPGEVGQQPSRGECIQISDRGLCGRIGNYGGA